MMSIDESQYNNRAKMTFSFHFIFGIQPINGKKKNNLPFTVEFKLARQMSSSSYCQIRQKFIKTLEEVNDSLF